MQSPMATVAGGLAGKAWHRAVPEADALARGGRALRWWRFLRDPHYHIVGSSRIDVIWQRGRRGRGSARVQHRELAWERLLRMPLPCFTSSPLSNEDDAETQSDRCCAHPGFGRGRRLYHFPRRCFWSSHGQCCKELSAWAPSCVQYIPGGFQSIPGGVRLSFALHD